MDFQWKWNSHQNTWFNSQSSIARPQKFTWNRSVCNVGFGLFCRRRCCCCSKLRCYHFENNFISEIKFALNFTLYTLTHFFRWWSRSVCERSLGHDCVALTSCRRCLLLLLPLLLLPLCFVLHFIHSDSSVSFWCAALRRNGLIRGAVWTLRSFVVIRFAFSFSNYDLLCDMRAYE